MLTRFLRRQIFRSVLLHSYVTKAGSPGSLSTEQGNARVVDGDRMDYVIVGCLIDLCPSLWSIL